MSPILVAAVIATILALLAYSLATWTIFRSTVKSRKQMIYYWLGFLFDLSGTIGMAIIAGGVHLTAHGIYGYSALTVMLVICLWLTRLPVDGNFGLFKKVSLIAWLFWLGSFISGMMQGMN